MAPGPVTSWQIDGETMGTVTDFIFLVSKITADGDCSHEIRRHLLLGRKAMTNLDSILKSTGIALQTKVHLVKAMDNESKIFESESQSVSLKFLKPILVTILTNQNFLYVSWFLFVCLFIDSTFYPLSLLPNTA